MMRLTGQKIFDATQTLSKIIQENRPLPGKGAYRVVKMHKALFVEFGTINDQRTAKIATYEHKAWVDGNGKIVSAEEAVTMTSVTEQNAVPDDKMAEFVAWWKDLASVETDVNIEPIPLSQLCADGAASSISLAEFSVLDDLVKED